MTLSKTHKMCDRVAGKKVPDVQEAEKGEFRDPMERDWRSQSGSSKLPLAENLLHGSQ